MLSVSHWKEKLYPHLRQRAPMEVFNLMLEEYLRPDSRVLDVDAGAGERSRYQLRGRVAEMVGVDLDPRVRDNPLLDRGIVSDVTRLPFPSEAFDVAFSISVLEHIKEPSAFVTEMARVLRPGGIFLAVTPNRVHYVPLLATLTPTAFHKWVNRKRGRPEEDTFPTYYRLNSRRALKKYFGEVGLAPVRLETIEFQPNYLTWSLPTFLAGALYERIVNSTEAFSMFRVAIFCVFRK